MCVHTVFYYSTERGLCYGGALFADSTFLNEGLVGLFPSARARLFAIVLPNKPLSLCQYVTERFPFFEAPHRAPSSANCRGTQSAAAKCAVGDDITSLSEPPDLKLYLVPSA